MHEILLPVIVDGARRGEESLPAESLGGSRFRLAGSPGIVEGLAAGDELEVDDREPAGFRLLRRAGNLCVWFYFASEVTEADPDVQRLASEVGTIGGWLDGGQSTMLVFTIPVRSGFPAVERVFNHAQERHVGSQWLYGNVYDPKDGKTPLDWWK